VGYFYLRLAGRRPASALLPSPDELGRPSPSRDARAPLAS
jgi:hypothetical protein